MIRPIYFLLLFSFFALAPSASGQIKAQLGDTIQIEHRVFRNVYPGSLFFSSTAYHPDPFQFGYSYDSTSYTTFFHPAHLGEFHDTVDAVYSNLQGHIVIETIIGYGIGIPDTAAFITPHNSDDIVAYDPNLDRWTDTLRFHITNGTSRPVSVTGWSSSIPLSGQNLVVEDSLGRIISGMQLDARSSKEILVPVSFAVGSTVKDTDFTATITSNISSANRNYSLTDTVNFFLKSAEFSKSISLSKDSVIFSSIRYKPVFDTISVHFTYPWHSSRRVYENFPFRITNLDSSATDQRLVVELLPVTDGVYPSHITLYYDFTDVHGFSHSAAKKIQLLANIHSVALDTLHWELTNFPVQDDLSSLFCARDYTLYGLDHPGILYRIRNNGDIAEPIFDGVEKATVNRNGELTIKKDGSYHYQAFPDSSLHTLGLFIPFNTGPGQGPTLAEATYWGKDNAYALAGARGGGSSNECIYKSTDFGQTWHSYSECYQGNYDIFRNMEADSSDEPYLSMVRIGPYGSRNPPTLQYRAAATKDTILRLEMDQLYGHSIQQLAITPDNQFLAGTNDGGVYRSVATSNQWYAFNDGLPDRALISALTVRPDGTAFAFVSGKGLYRSSRRFQAVKNAVSIPQVRPSRSLLLLYPNPATTQISLQAPEPIERVRIVNELGQIVLDVLHPNALSIPIQSLRPGAYQVQAQTANGELRARMIKSP